MLKQSEETAVESVRSWSREEMLSRQQAAQNQLFQMQNEDSAEEDPESTVHDLEERIAAMSKDLQGVTPAAPAASAAPAAPSGQASAPARSHSHQDQYTHGLALDAASPGLYRRNGTFKPYRSAADTDDAAPTRQPKEVSWGVRRERHLEQQL